MGVTVYEVKYEGNEVGASDSKIADFLEKYIGPNPYTKVYSISEEYLLELLDDESIQGERRETIEALLKRVREIDNHGTVDFAF